MGSESQLVARGFQYLEANGISHAYTVDPNNASLDGRSVAVALQSPRNVVVTLVRNVPAPFANAVGEMLMTYENVHNVQGLSEIRAYPGPMPTWIAPLACKYGWLGSYEEMNKSKAWDVPASLWVEMQEKGDIDEYYDDSGDPSSVDIRVVALDLYNTFTSNRSDLVLKRNPNQKDIDAYNVAVAQSTQALDEYKQAMLTGVDTEGGRVFAIEQKQNQVLINTAPFIDTQGWIDATKAGIANIISQSKYPTESSIDALGENKYAMVDYNDPRFVALTLGQRATGQSDFDMEFKGYVGFFISGYEEIDGKLRIKGWFHRLALNVPDRPDGDIPGIPNVDEQFSPGMFTFKFVR